MVEGAEVVVCALIELISDTVQATDCAWPASPVATGQREGVPTVRLTESRNVANVCQVNEHLDTRKKSQIGSLHWPSALPQTKTYVKNVSVTDPLAMHSSLFNLSILKSILTQYLRCCGYSYTLNYFPHCSEISSDF